MSKSPPRLKNLDDLFRLNDSEVALPPPEQAPKKKVAANAEYARVPFELMDDFPDHPFQLYEGERRSDMVESIRANGMLVPLILHAMDNGRFQILSGHNRKYAGIEAGFKECPAVIKRGLTDDEAMVYIVETNLMQRSFADMSHSEKAAVIVLQHSKLFSQGKRNDVLEELQMLENPHEYRANGTCAGIAQKLDSRSTVAREYSLSKDQVANYLRISKLITVLKTRLDNGSLGVTSAVTLSFLKESEQQLLDKCIDLNKFAVDMKKADILRQYSEKGKLTEDNIYLILSSKVGQKPKPNRTPTIKVSKSVYAKYFKSSQSAKEIQDVVEKALELYFERAS